MHVPSKQLPPEGKGISLKGPEDEIALFRVNGELLAVRNSCPHQHFARLHEGEVEGSVVTCPMHGWKFDLKTGAHVAGAGSLKCYEVILGEHGADVEPFDP